MTASEDEPASQATEAEPKPVKQRGHHTPALIILWIVILAASYFIWPSKSYLFDHAGESAPNAPLKP